MRVLDLFSGLGGVARVFRERGHEVVTLDFEPRFGCDMVRDIMTVTSGELGGAGAFDFVWASPPCEGFSVASMCHHWTGGFQGYVPATDHARLSIEIVAHTLDLISELGPGYWLMENPRGMLRKLPVVAGVARRTVTYCQYGLPYMKPTDLWGDAPPMLFRPMCANNAPCHIAAPRGSRTGIQDDRLSAAERAVVPALLIHEICDALESVDDLLSA